ncbi:hypothetical protein SAY87_002232 [Trapa incisa]|uniref:Uncharacterized protein n=1 Tax=Trapa incisa TaxID=236973 RepID=A0AAN7PUW9_9MYRT|nr:hypothetical protein SAY87_002232 [Trapa incisa]
MGYSHCYIEDSRLSGQAAPDWKPMSFLSDHDEYLQIQDLPSSCYAFPQKAIFCMLLFGPIPDRCTSPPEEDFFQIKHWRWPYQPSLRGAQVQRSHRCPMRAEAPQRCCPSARSD